MKKIARFKKSQGLSLNVIIIAAIVLIVLIVLWSIFTGRMGGFTKELNECEPRGECMPASQCKYPEGVKSPDLKCPDDVTEEAGMWSFFITTENQVCCVPLE